MEVGDKVQLTEEFINRHSYPWSEMAKLRYFEVLSLPNEYGVVKLKRGDLASGRIQSYHISFLEPVPSP